MSSILQSAFAAALFLCVSMKRANIDSLKVQTGGRCWSAVLPVTRDVIVSLDFLFVFSTYTTQAVMSF